MAIHLKAVFKSIITDLQLIYDKHEAQSIAFLLLEFLYQSTRTDILADKTIDNFDEKILQDCLTRLKKNEPIQYIIGKGHFYGYDFFVNHTTLIPRPETEELVHKVIADYQHHNKLKIIDIGTGTGCIPITLSLHLSTEIVYGVDIDNETLATATQNSNALQTSIKWLQADVLQWQNSLAQFENFFDIVISNPPYITENEKVVMKNNVLDYEPHKALFVNDKTPLIFYEAIADFALKALKNGGALYFEINEQFGKETKLMLENKGFILVTIFKDLNDKERMIKAVKKS
jgi:release factor glutamine methyltransferase